MDKNTIEIDRWELWMLQRTIKEAYESAKDLESKSKAKIPITYADWIYFLQNFEFTLENCALATKEVVTEAEIKERFAR